MLDSLRLRPRGHFAVSRNREEVLAFEPEYALGRWNFRTRGTTATSYLHHPFGTAIDPASVRKAFNALLANLRFPHMRLHDLRHAPRS